MTEIANDPQIQSALVISRFLIIVPFTILVYEYLLTLEREASRFWGKRLTWGSAFFYLNRYSSLLGTVPIVFQYYSTTTDPAKLPMCRTLREYHQYFALISQLLVGLMLIIRTYALYERNKTVLAFTIFVTLAAFCFAVWVLLTGNDVDTLSAEEAAFGCPMGTPHGKSLRIAAAWSGMLVFDVMIFGLTLFKALRHRGSARGGLISVLLRDGSVYFALMIISNAANVATYTMGGPFIRGSATTVTNVASSVMISRLMFNLGDTRGTRAETYATREPPALSTLSPYASEYAMDTRWTSDEG
ncbi:hypothetical protein FB451DRAFT_1238409 [Mycena latifolia]|nr:hypothetical protein FB451DRAFT_1238409 [Mycena latifolia]